MDDLLWVLNAEDGPVRISAGNLLEAAIVVDGKRDPVVSRDFDLFLETRPIEVEPFTAKQAAIARQAYRDFGKGSGHSAQLNMGDCFAYALSKDKGEPLLYKGDAFSHTDVRPALQR